MNQPWLAALLNLILPGLGYLYNRQRILLGLGLTFFFTMVYVSIFTSSATTGSSGSAQMISPIQQMLTPISALFFYFAVAQDAHSEAEKIKKEKLGTSNPA